VQVREWARQDYPRTVYALRRHALIAANATEYETIWGLIARVKAEADADPVGGTFFALPQLWLKFGIAMGLERHEMIESTPHPELRQANEAMVDELRFSGAMPLMEFIDAMLDPVFYRLWGEALASSLGLEREQLDFFWAIAADRWGAETGRAILENWAGKVAVSGDAIKAMQTALWKRLAEEMKEGREWQRFSILETLLDRVAG
jgi:pyrroloquinoline quinone (PQQ) biosynthesis protein C